MGFGDAMRKIIGIEEEEEYEEITQEEIDAEKERLSIEDPVKPMEPQTGFNIEAPKAYDVIAPSVINKPAQNKVYSMNGSGPFKMLVIEPKNFEECTKLVDNLKSRKPVIINLEKVETDLARKMFDFLSGATYALNGNVQRVTSNIFIFAPANVDIAAKLSKSDTNDGGYSNKSNPWR